MNKGVESMSLFTILLLILSFIVLEMYQSK